MNHEFEMLSFFRLFMMVSPSKIFIIQGLWDSESDDALYSEEVIGSIIG
jgi:hypothetical protein